MFPYGVVDNLSFFRVKFCSNRTWKGIKLINVLGRLLVLAKILNKFLSNISAKRVSSNAVINIVGKGEIVKEHPPKVCRCGG